MSCTINGLKRNTQKLKLNVGMKTTEQKLNTLKKQRDSDQQLVCAAASKIGRSSVHILPKNEALIFRHYF